MSYDQAMFQILPSELVILVALFVYQSHALMINSPSATRTCPNHGLRVNLGPRTTTPPSAAELRIRQAQTSLVTCGFINGDAGQLTSTDFRMILRACRCSSDLWLWFVLRDNEHVRRLLRKIQLSGYLHKMFRFAWRFMRSIMSEQSGEPCLVCSGIGS